MPVRGPSISKLEENFTLRTLASGVRLDQRNMMEYRPIKITYGIDYGYCTVDVGDTKVMAQVACVLDRPKESRPSEGRLNVHVEMSSIAYPSFDPTKPGELGISIQRMLERSLLLSRAVDLEEMCIRVGEKVWTIQLYVHVLSFDGNIIDCAFVAAIAALKHFKRPDITVTGQDVVIHTMEEKNPVPLTLHHMPLCVTFAFFQGCEYMVIDPTFMEEHVMDGSMMISLNKHKEICSLQMSGQLKITKEKILNCTNLAAAKVKELTALVLDSLKNDEAEKKAGKTYSRFMQKSKNSEKDVLTSSEQPMEEIQIEKLSVKDTDVEKTDKNGFDHNATPAEKPYWVKTLGTKTATIGEGEVNSWEESNPPDAAGIFSTLRKAPADEDSSSGSEDEIVLMDSTALNG